jgi:hypothetical protein
MRPKILRLRPWDETTGVLQRINDDETIEVLDLGSFQVQITSDEMALIREQLLEITGKRVSILKTDIPEKPIIMRVIDDE